MDDINTFYDSDQSRRHKGSMSLTMERTMRSVALALVFCFSFVVNSWAQSVPDPQSQGLPNGQQKQEPRPPNLDRAPTVVKTLPPGEVGAVSKKQEGGLVEWSLSDRIAATVSFAAFLQFIALLATVFIMIRNGRRQLRAYLMPHAAAILDGMMLAPPDTARKNVPGVILSFKNSGQTPAYKVVSWGQIQVTEPANEEQLVAPVLEQRYSTSLGAGEEMPKAVWYTRALTAIEIAEIGSGAKAIYFYGRIEYQDAFRKTRRSNFRLRYGGLFPPPQGVIFQNCEGGNDAN